MVLHRWKTAAGLFALFTIAFGGLLAAGLTNYATVSTILFDDFDDGSVLDGTPVSWRPEGATLEIQDDSLIVSGRNLPRTTPQIGSHTNVSIKAQARLLEGEVLGFTGRRTVGTTNYHVFVGHFETPGSPPSNDAGIGYGGNNTTQTLTSSPIPFDPRLEDFNLQFDIIGDEIRFWVWRLNEPRPTAPLGTVVDNRLQTGEVEVYAGSQSLSSSFTGRAAFRYVHVATTSIPEPPGTTLAAVGGGVLAVAFLFGRLRLSAKFRRF
jgi:hypothetical protein